MQNNMTSLKKRHYKPVEDKILCEAWLTVSKNSIYDIYPSCNDFCDKVKTDFDAERARLRSTVAERPIMALSSRFQMIS